MKILAVDRLHPEHAIVVVDASDVASGDFDRLVVPFTQVGGGTRDAVAGSWEYVRKRDGSTLDAHEALSAVRERVSSIQGVPAPGGSGVTGWVLARFSDGWNYGRLTVLGDRELRTPTVDLTSGSAP